MEIIGKTKEGYILKASKNEVANLIGFYSDYSDEFRSKGLEIGDSIQISKMYNRLYKQERSSKDLERTAQTLRTIADLLEPLDPIIKALSEDKVGEVVDE